MEESELDFSNPEVFSSPHVGNTPTSCSMDSFFDEILKDTHHHSCTHTHTCNPPGRDLSHTHTCFHVHTKILSGGPADQSADSAEKSPSSPTSKKRPFGNREAVRKYREKKKAHTASLEDEVAQLRAMNEQLMKRLQGQAPLEAEVARLRCLLVDIRGRIEGEIGSFPYQKIARAGADIGGRSVSDMRVRAGAEVGGRSASDMSQGNLISNGGGGTPVVNYCDFQCDDQMYCFNAGVQGRAVGENGAANGQGFGVCEMANVECLGSGSKSFVGCGPGSAMTAGCSSNAEKN